MNMKDSLGSLGGEASIDPQPGRELLLVEDLNKWFSRGTLRSNHVLKDVNLKVTKGEVLVDKKHARKSPEQVLRERAQDDGQGLFGFLRTVDKKWTVTYDENDDQAKYKLNNTQDLAWGAADDRSRNWREIDPRRIEGPIPVECRSASCGTCWVGVLGGAEKLADVAAREGKKIKEFGYIDTTEPRPVIRLACQAQAHGAVSIVIPPWNGVFGKRLQDRELASSNAGE